MVTQALAAHDQLIAEGIRRNGGSILAAPDGGDGFYAAFPGAAQAVAAAWALRQELAWQPWLAAVPLRVRIAVHTDLNGADPWGAMEVCGTVQAVAGDGQVVLSGSTAELVRDSLPPGTKLLPVSGELSDEDGPAWPAFELVDADDAVPEPPATASASGPWNGEVELDRHLADLVARTDAVSRDLAAVRSSLVYRLVLGPEGASGSTRAHASAALEPVAALAPGFELLQDMLDEVATARDGGASLDPDELRELEWLLLGPSMELPHRSCTPGELLEAMAQAVTSAAAVVAEVGDAWKRVMPVLAQHEAEVAALLEEARALGAADLTEDLDRLRLGVTALTARAGHDPLGAAESLRAELPAQLDDARARIAEERRQQQAVAASLEGARAKLAELRDVHRRAADGIWEVRMTIANPRDLRPPLDAAYLDQPPMGLGPWLARLEALCRAGSHRPVRKGLERWQQAVDEALAGERRILASNQAPLERRRELRALLVALEAKAAAVLASENHDLSDLGRRAKAALFTSPTDLDDAAFLVGRYQERLRSMTSKEVSHG